MTTIRRIRIGSSGQRWLLILIALLILNAPHTPAAGAEDKAAASASTTEKHGAGDAAKVATVANSEAVATPKHGVCMPEQIPPFPLPLLTKEEREARLRFYMSDTPLHLVERAEEVEEKTCGDILQHLQSFSSVTVLEPAFSTWQPNEATSQTVAPNCPHLNLDTEFYTGSPLAPHFWRPTDAKNRDPAFLARPREEKEGLSRSYQVASANFEYYDLSRYLGSGFWGYFAEGAHVFQSSYNNGEEVVHVNPPTQILEAFCVPLFATIEKIVNVQTCTTASDPYRPVNRIGSIVYPQGAQGNMYPLANFYAFLDIGGKLYRLNAQMFHPPHDMRYQILPEARSLNIFIDATTGTGRSVAVKQICAFSTIPKLGSGWPVPPGISH